MSGPLFDLLPWDSNHFGFRIARAAASQVDAISCQQLVAACRGDAIDCLYFLVDASGQDSITALQSNGFDFIDIRLTLAAQCNGAPVRQVRPDSLRYRHANEPDLAQLLPLASKCFGQSRFYVDPRFGRHNASRMFQIWLQNGFADKSGAAVIVAEQSDVAVGFVTCHLHQPAGEGNIGLVGVAESARGLGCAGGMIQYASRWFAQRGLDHMNVVTQGRNVAAQRLYQRSGFVTRSVELWFHKWFD